MDIEELISKASEGTLSEKDAIEFACEQDISLDEFTHVFARIVAESYDSGNFSYDYSNGAINWLYGFMTNPAYLDSNANNISEFPLNVYLAFDAGEYHHPRDDESVDPVNQYTDPAIKEILSPD